MKYNAIPRTDIKVSEIGFGCMSLQNNQRENERLIHHAVEMGVNYFDTADIYNGGENETSVGLALKSIRQQVILATKVGNIPKQGGGWQWNASGSYIIQAVDNSLRRLKTDYIDIYQLHGGTIEDDVDDTISAFESLKKQGKIRYYGISSIRPNVISKYVSSSKIVSAMMQYSLLDRRPEENCLSLLKDNGIGVFARGSLAGGLLVNKPPTPYLGYSMQEVAQAAAAVNKISGSERTAAQSAIRFVLANEAVTAVTLGISTHNQLEEAVSIRKSPMLSVEEFDCITRILLPEKYSQHRF